MPELSIKPLGATELQSVAALFRRQLSEHEVSRSPNELIAALEVLLDQPQRGFVLVAFSGGMPIGVAYGACILSLEHGGWSGWLEELYVLPEWRGCGVGSALLAAVVASARERRWAALDLEVDSNHQRVIPLYQRNHFEPLSRTRFVYHLR